MVLVVKNPPVNAGDVRDSGLILGSGRSAGEGNGNPFLYSCLGNPMDRGAWQHTVHGVAKEPDNLATKQLSKQGISLFQHTNRIDISHTC